ncbi:hypothetical protein EB796_020970 [Bugula neritina]|uniref:Uncharacterized protein n=1 Tax=Bugula neritina TaxID=10212 RepID=A0A7J7J3D0_BUGNE|nr:hypothetical protein EB796_020970 [Bugula neritina]
MLQQHIIAGFPSHVKLCFYYLSSACSSYQSRVTRPNSWLVERLYTTLTTDKFLLFGAIILGEFGESIYLSASMDLFEMHYKRN